MFSIHIKLKKWKEENKIIMHFRFNKKLFFACVLRFVFREYIKLLFYKKIFLNFFYSPTQLKKQMREQLIIATNKCIQIHRHHIGRLNFQQIWLFRISHPPRAEVPTRLRSRGNVTPNAPLFRRFCQLTDQADIGTEWLGPGHVAAGTVLEHGVRFAVNGHVNCAFTVPEI